MRLPALVLLVAAAGSSAAQVASRPLTLVPQARYELGRLGQARDALLAIAPGGRVVSTTRYGGGVIQAFDAAARPLPWKLTTGRRDDAEIMVPTRVGWIAGTSSTWVADGGYRQVAIIDDGGKVVQSIENPSWVHPHWAERRRYPVFASMEPLALYPDHSMLVMPGRERSFIATPAFDRSVLHLLRISVSGAIERSVATLPLEDGRMDLRSQGCSRFAAVPFANHTEWALTGDGAHIVIVAPPVAPADSASFRVVSLDERGDTLFARRYPQPALRIPQPAIDSYLAALQDCGRLTAAQIRSLAAKQIPTFKSFVTGVVAGQDGSVAVTLRALADSSHDRMVVVLDPRGDVVGSVPVPLNQAVVDVSRGQLWIVEPGMFRTAPAALVRYGLSATAAPPSRSAPASASSTRLHPPG